MLCFLNFHIKTVHVKKYAVTAPWTKHDIASAVVPILFVFLTIRKRKDNVFSIRCKSH